MQVHTCIGGQGSRLGTPQLGSHLGFFMMDPPQGGGVDNADFEAGCPRESHRWDTSPLYRQGN